jgi:hypothetical protein
MPRPTSVVTENDFPLDDGGNEESYVEDKFPVLVMWHDLSETPSQYIERLGAEAMNVGAAAEAERRAKLMFQQRIDRMAQFALRRDETGSARTNLVHGPCGKTVGTLNDQHAAGGWALDVLFERAVGHDCTIEGLVTHHTPAVQNLAKRLVTALADPVTHPKDQGYLTALTLVLWQALELPDERRLDVATYLWTEAGQPSDAVPTPPHWH